MYELKRFTMKSTRGIRSVAKPDGMWCRYNDVERIFYKLKDNNYTIDFYDSLYDLGNKERNADTKVC